MGRKNNRLKDYDYSRAGAYFLTICTKDNHKILGKVVGDGVLDVLYCKLSEIGKIVDMQIQTMNNLYKHVQVEEYVIMPNHIHLIIFVDNNGSSRTPTPTNAAIPSFISTLKRYTNKACGLSIWQRSYHDHIIRNGPDYLRIWQYIEQNPAKWTEDRYFVDG